MTRIVTLRDGTRIGEARVYVIAEAGVNHNGDLARALEMIDVAAEAGADAVKFQTFAADRLVTASAPKAAYQAAATGAGGQQEMLAALELTRSDYEKLQDRCASRNITFLSTPFEEESADILESLDVPAFKLPSGEINNLPFLRYVATKGRPMIVSTGMADMEEVASAVAAIEEAGNDQIVLLHCLSQYPADPKEANLRAMTTMETFGYPVGYSDHTPGSAVTLAAVALGASVIEKHFTLDQSLPGPDHKASLIPEELATLVTGIRTVEDCLGDGRKRRQPSEEDTARVARKSLVAAVDIEIGAVIEPDMIVMRRPGVGIAPGELERVLGRRPRRRISRDSMLDWADLA